MGRQGGVGEAGALSYQGGSGGPKILNYGGAGLGLIFKFLKKWGQLLIFLVDTYLVEKKGNYPPKWLLSRFSVITFLSVIVPGCALHF